MEEPTIPPGDLAGLILTDEEQEWFHGGLPIDLALQKIIRNHHSERCVTCSRFIGSHTVKAAKKCIQTQAKEEAPNA